MTIATRIVSRAEPAGANVSLGTAASFSEGPAASVNVSAREAPRASLAIITPRSHNLAIAPPATTARTTSRLARHTPIPSKPLSDANELEIDGSTLSAVNVRFDIPLMTSDAARGLSLITARGQMRNVITADGSEIADGLASMTLVARGRDVVGVLAGSTTFSPDTTFVRRGNSITVPMVNGGNATLAGGTFRVQNGQVIGIGRHSTALFEGVRFRSGDDPVDISFETPNRYSVNAPVTVLETPATRTVHIAGASIEVRTSTGRYDLDNGQLAINGNGATVNAERGNVRLRVSLPAPRPATAQREDIASGKIGLASVPEAQLFIDGVSDRDVDQGQTGDCWFIACVLALAATRPELIRTMITDNNDGTYTVRLFRKGKRVEVRVDGDFYQYTGAFVPRGTMVYGKSREPREIWGPVLEKARAALFDDGYQGIYGGQPGDGFRELTGLASTEVKNRSLSADKLFDQLTRAAAAHTPMVAVSGTTYKNQEEQSRLDKAMQDTWGLRNWHAYAIIGTRIEDGHRYVIMRNTAPDCEFTGNGYDGNVDLDGRGASTQRDGYFRIRIEDYQQLFATTTTLTL